MTFRTRTGIAASAAALAALLFAGAAQAQYRGNSGYDGYPDGYGAPAYGGYGYAQPAYRPAYNGQPAASPYDRQGYGYGQPQQPAYSDPYGSGYGGGVAAGGGYQLGPNANVSTREQVANTTSQPPGTIVVDTASRHLYYTEANGQAFRYGIGVGRQGFLWKGTAKVERKAEWPSWTPPSDMLKRRPDLPTRMSGGIENPLGARALYLFKGKRDTLFRIHGTNEPDTIGKAVSSGCIRMMNADVIDLYRRVPVGTKVVVL